MKIRALLVACLVALLIPGVAMAQAPRLGTIQGQLKNGTAGGSSVANQDVTIFAVSGDNSTTHTTVQSDASGRFTFSNIRADAGSSYVVGVSFQGADYYTDAQSFSDNESTKSVDLTVYDSTSSDSAISIVSAHTVVFEESGVFRIQEVYVFANMSDRTYVGTNDPATGTVLTLRFSLPPGYTELEPAGNLTSSGIVSISDGFADTVPVQPGSEQVYYTYRVPITSSRYKYVRAMEYPTLKYNMLIPGENIKVVGDNLTASGTTDMGGTKYAGFSGSNYAKGYVLQAQISGLSKEKQTPVAVWFGAGALALALTGAVTYLLISRRRPRAVSPVVSRSEEELLGALAELDDDFEKGRISEGAYRKERSALKAELVDLIEEGKRSNTGG